MGAIVGKVKAANMMPPLLAPRDESMYYDIPEYEAKYGSNDNILQYILKQS